MKKNIIVIMTVLITLCLSACGSNNSNNQTIIFEQRVNDQYLSIIWEDREYVPYCAINPKNRGTYLGYLKDENIISIVRNMSIEDLIKLKYKDCDKIINFLHDKQY